MTEQYKSPESVSERNKKLSKVAKYVIIAALSGVIVVGATGCTSIAEGDPFTRFDPKVESVTISPDAKLRSEPNVPNRYDQSNIVETTDDTLTVQVDEGIEIRDNGINGEFYRIPVENIAHSNQNLDLKSDPDGYVWVNEQRATPNRD